MRPIYVEIPGYVERNQSILTRLLTREAVLRDFVYWAGRLWDVEHWSISRDAYVAYLHQLSAGLATPPGVMTRGAFDERLGEFLDPLGQRLELAGLDSLGVLEAAVLIEQLCGVSVEATLAALYDNSLPDLQALYSRHVSHSLNTLETIGGSP